MCSFYPRAEHQTEQRLPVRKINFARYLLLLRKVKSLRRSTETLQKQARRLHFNPT